MSVLRIVCSAGTALLTSTATAQLLAEPQWQWIGGQLRHSCLEGGDVNGDGHLDAVVIDFSGSVFSMLGNGQGGLTGPIVSLSGISNPGKAVLLDVDGDGDLDLVLGGMFAWSENIRVLSGDNTGAFVPNSLIPGLGQRFVIADFNGDARPDVAAIRATDIGIAFATGAGGFGPVVTRSFPSWVTLSSSAYAASAEAGDFNGDGITDLLAVRYHYLAAGIERILLFGTGNGQFQNGVLLPGSPAMLVAGTGDFDHNGALDVVYHNPQSRPAVGLNDGTGVFHWPLPVLEQSGPGTLRAGDIDADGNPDLVSLDTNGLDSHHLLVYRGDGKGQFLLVLHQALAQPQRFAIGDFDEDGRADVVVSGPQFIAVLRNLLPTPVGIVPYGTGTPTCSGTIGMWGTPKPAIGATGFRVLCSNAPANASGNLWVGPGIPGGVVLPGLGVRLHVGSPLPLGTMHSDAAGVGSLRLPIPAIPALVGLVVDLQSSWIGDAGLGNTCSPGMGELATSRGLSITLQP